MSTRIIFSKKYLHSLLLISTLIIVYLTAFLLIKDKWLFVDEEGYYLLIKDIAQFKFTPDLLSITAALPGYPLIVGLVELFLGASTIAATRSISAILSATSIVIFYLIASRIDAKSAMLKTLQYFFFPILFVFFFLIYTDVFSLLIVLITFLLVLKKRYYWSGFFGFLSLLIRQNNIIWLGFFCIYIFFDKYKLQKINIATVVKYFRNILLFISSFIISILFIVFNNGVVMGDRGSYPLSFHLENIFFMLFLFFFLFLPLNMANLPKVVGLFKTKPQALLLTMLLVDIFLLFLLAFKADHPYNTPLNFLRNYLLSLIIDNPFNKSISFMPIGYSILSLCVTPLKNKKHYLIYPFTFIFLGLLWLIEQRYYLIPFIFFILFKKHQSFLIEFSTLVIYIFLAEIIFFIVLSGRFFL